MVDPRFGPVSWDEGPIVEVDFSPLAPAGSWPSTSVVGGESAGAGVPGFGAASGDATLFSGGDIATWEVSSSGSGLILSISCSPDSSWVVP